VTEKLYVYVTLYFEAIFCDQGKDQAVLASKAFYEGHFVNGNSLVGKVVEPAPNLVIFEIHALD
jgi:hypothetical protein